jgi:hypothetical protein
MFLGCITDYTEMFLDQDKEYPEKYPGWITEYPGWLTDYPEMYPAQDTEYPAMFLC